MDHILSELQKAMGSDFLISSKLREFAANPAMKDDKKFICLMGASFPDFTNAFDTSDLPPYSELVQDFFS